jgi:RNA polymerase sigma-70 factor, ECF subfamily
MHGEPPSDSGLIRQAQAGDSQSIALLFARNEALVRRRIHRRLSPAVRRKVADSDVLQETWVTAARRLPEFENRGPGSFQAWVTAIADNAARKVLQRHLGTQKRDVRAEVSRDARATTVQHPDAQPSPSHVAMADETRQRVAEALRDMPEDYQTVIQLLQHRRATLAEASELMGRSLNAVKKLHARALADLADRLGIEGRGRS